MEQANEKNKAISRNKSNNSIVPVILKKYP